MYIMENEDENYRLEIKTDIAVVEEFSRRAGLRAGMRVLDAVCGPGLTTAAFASIVGERGAVVGIDNSQARISHAQAAYGDSRTEFHVRDILKPLEDLGSFDFVWMRFALEYYKAESFEIVRNMASTLREGGTLCLVDLDYNCLNHYGMSARLETAFRCAVNRLEEKANFDPYAGRRLYSHLYTLGFQDICVEVEAHHLIYGELNKVDAYNWGKKLEVIAGKLPMDLPGYSSADEFREDFMAFFRNPGRFTYTPVISAWGRKSRGQA